MQLFLFLGLISEKRLRISRASGQRSETACGGNYSRALPTFEDVTKGKYFDELVTQDSETTRYGFADSDFALRLYHKFAERSHLRSEITLIIGDVNIGANASTKKFKDYLYKERGLPVLKAADKNGASAGRTFGTLEKLD